jgi:hypothetical protein
MRLNPPRLIFLLVAAFVLGLGIYREFEAFSVSATDYKVPSANLDNWLAGDWYVADVAGYARDKGIGEEAAADLVGKTANVHDHEFVFDDLHCPAPFNRSEEHIVDFSIVMWLRPSCSASTSRLRGSMPAARTSFRLLRIGCSSHGRVIFWKQFGNQGPSLSYRPTSIVIDCGLDTYGSFPR